MKKLTEWIKQHQLFAFFVFTYAFSWALWKAFASLILWVLWAIWHAPAYLGGFEAQSLADTLIEWAFVLPGTIVFTWFYNRAKGSLLATALLHPAMNTTAHLLPITLGTTILLAAFDIRRRPRPDVGEASRG